MSKTAKQLLALLDSIQGSGSFATFKLNNFNF